ncbi:MAG: PAS domain-containing protein [Vulcanimicrobiaceae bacterium]
MLGLVISQAGMQIAVVVLWDGDWPWLTRSVGLQDECSLDIRILGRPQSYIAADAALDENLATSSLVLGAERIRFVATAPILSSNGALLGTLAVLDRTPHDDGAKLEPLLRHACAALTGIVAQHRMPSQQSEQTQMLERAVDAAQSGIAVCCLNSDGTMPRFLYVNNAIVRRSGLSRGQYLSARRGVFDQGSNIAFARRIAEQMRSGDEAPFETEYQGANGTTYALSIHCSRLETQEGEAPHYIVVTEDITERKNRTEITRLFESLVAETSDLIVITDATRPSAGGPHIRFTNDAMSAFLQRPSATLTGRPVRMLVSDVTDERTLQTIDQHLERFLPIANEVAFRRGDNEKAWASFTGQPLRDDRGEPTHWLFTGRDITARKQHYRQTTQFAEALDASDEPIIMYDVVAPYGLEMSYQNRAATERGRDLATTLLGEGEPTNHMLVLWHRLEKDGAVQRMACVQSGDEPGAWVSLEVRPTCDEVGALASLTLIQHVPGTRSRMPASTHPMLFAIALAEELLSYSASADRVDALATILETEWLAQVVIQPVAVAPLDSCVIIGDQTAEFISADGVIAQGSASRIRITWDLPLTTDMTTALRLFLETIAKRNLVA